MPRRRPFRALGRLGVVPGQRRRLRRLRTTAVYEVLEVEREYVRVRVVDVPGLQPGAEIRLAARAVEAMEVVG